MPKRYRLFMEWNDYKMIAYDILEEFVKWVEQGLKHNKETLRILSEKFSGDKNPAWKGDDAGYNAFHNWVRKIKIKPDCCEKCGKKTKGLELAKISEEYTRNPKDYEYLCYRCHKILDGTIYNMNHSENRIFEYGDDLLS